MCWNHGAVWDSWAVERERWTQRIPRDDAVRVSDADREAVISQLSRNTGEGRLSLEEFEARVEEVYASKTQRDLRVALRELPAERRTRHRRDRSFRVPPVVVLFIIIGVVSLAPAFLWWMIPIAACTVFGHGHRRHETPIEDRREELTSV